MATAILQLKLTSDGGEGFDVQVMRNICDEPEGWLCQVSKVFDYQGYFSGKCKVMSYAACLSYLLEEEDKREDQGLGMLSPEQKRAFLIELFEDYDLLPRIEEQR